MSARLPTYKKVQNTQTSSCNKTVCKIFTTKHWNNFRHIRNFARHTMNLIRHVRHLLIVCTVHLIIRHIRHSAHFNLALQAF